MKCEERGKSEFDYGRMRTMDGSESENEDEVHLQMSYR